MKTFGCSLLALINSSRGDVVDCRSISDRVFPATPEVPMSYRNVIRGVVWFVVEIFSQAKHFAIIYRSSKKIALPQNSN
jgi:hypothetical protein